MPVIQTYISDDLWEVYRKQNPKMCHSDLKKKVRKFVKDKFEKEVMK